MSDETRIEESRIPLSGDWVFHYPLGDPGSKPVPAMVLVDADRQRALTLELHLPGSISYVYASKHLGDNAHQRDRERSGGWAWNRTFTPKPPEK